MPTILIIDDNHDNAHVLQATLEVYGFDVYIAYTGEDGYDMATIHEPDLVITDLRMPSTTWTGYDTAAKLKSDPATANIPIIALSAAGDPIQAQESGCDTFLKRPINQQELRAALEHYLHVA